MFTILLEIKPLSNAFHLLILNLLYRTQGQEGERWYLSKFIIHDKQNWKPGSPKAASQIPNSAVKSRNTNLIEKCKTYEKVPNNVDESFQSISEIQNEAKVQVPIRFRSRESMMKFSQKDYYSQNEEFHMNSSTKISSI